MYMNNSPILAQAMTPVALWLASIGFFVIPLHSIGRSSLCTCGREDCRSRGKHPRTPNGSKDATRDPNLIKHMFEHSFPGSNIGITTGERAGIFVLDVDPRHGGECALAELELRQGELPTTVTSATGGGGLHFLFQHPGGTVKNSAGAIGRGLDIRGEGGLIVVPPSIHASGTFYTWVAGRSPSDTPIALAPPWLLALVQGQARDGTSVADRSHIRAAAKLGAVEGERNDSVARIAGHLLRHHIDPYIALDLLLAWNTVRNAPPLDDTEVKATVNSIAGRELNRRGGRHG